MSNVNAESQVTDLHKQNSDRLDWVAAARRRAEAARRLPPMACGCHDPLTTRHMDGRCRWRRQGDA